MAFLAKGRKVRLCVERNGRQAGRPVTSGPQVRSLAGKHYISNEDFLTYPATVREKILPKFKQLYVTREDEVVMVARLPKQDEKFEVEEF